MALSSYLSMTHTFVSWLLLRVSDSYSELPESSLQLSDNSFTPITITLTFPDNSLTVNSSPKSLTPRFNYLTTAWLRTPSPWIFLSTPWLRAPTMWQLSDSSHHMRWATVCADLVRRVQSPTQHVGTASLCMFPVPVKMRLATVCEDLVMRLLLSK